jgi:hypothetical protein
LSEEEIGFIEGMIKGDGVKKTKPGNMKLISGNRE